MSERKFSINGTCEIYIESKKAWVAGEVISMYTDNNKAMMTVRWSPTEKCVDIACDSDKVRASSLAAKAKAMSDEELDDALAAIDGDEYKMEYRMLGGTGLKVSVLGFGTMSLNSVKQAEELMSAARSFGVNFFDNAELYGEPCGEADRIFGTALKNLQKKDPALWRRSELVITNKIWFGPGDGQQPNQLMRPYGVNETGNSAKHMKEGMDGILKRMDLEYVDVVYSHRIDPLTPMLEVVRAFNDIIERGQAFYWGTSMWPIHKIVEAYWIAKAHKLIPPIVEQPQYNMFSRDTMEKDYVPLFEAPYNIGTTVFSPLDAGILTGKYVNKDKIDPDSRMGGGKNRLGKWWGSNVPDEKNQKVAKLMEIATEMKVSMVSLALGWVIKNKNVSVCILGGRKASQLLQNKHAITAAKRLDAEKMAKIDEILGNAQKPSPHQMWLDMVRGQQYLTDPQ